MDEEIKEKLSNTNTWIRGLYMLLFLFIMGAAKFAIGVLVLFQFLTHLFAGNINERLVSFSSSLAQYISQIILYVCYVTEEKPFPFNDWPTPDLTNTAKTPTETTKPALKTEPEKINKPFHDKPNPDEPINYQ